jgi:5-epi-alpha-selinene synthase
MDELLCPFTSALNPRTEAAHAHTRAWAERFGLVGTDQIARQVATERFTWLVGGFYPWAQQRELELISDFTSWLFWHDDVCDETTLGEDPVALAAQFDWLLGILGHARPVRRGDAFDRALADLRDRFEEAAPSRGWLARMVASVQQYFEGCVWEAANRRHGRVPGVDVYKAMRPFAGGMYIYRDFVELAARAELALVARAHPEVHRLEAITINVACWHNDLFSLEKELAYGDVHNLVVVLARERRLGVAEARAAAVDWCNDEVLAFERIVRRLPALGVEVDAAIAAHARSLGALMRGNFDWSLATARYQGSLAPQPKAAHVAAAR